MANLMVRTWDSENEQYVSTPVAELTPQQVEDWLYEDYSDEPTDDEPTVAEVKTLLDSLL